MRFLANLGIVLATAVVAAIVVLFALDAIYNYHTEHAEPAQSAVVQTQASTPIPPRPPDISDVEKFLAAFNDGDCQPIRQNASQGFLLRTDEYSWNSQCLALGSVLGRLRNYRGQSSTETDVTIGAADTDEGIATVIIGWVWEEGQNRLKVFSVKTRARALLIPDRPYRPFKEQRLIDSPMPRRPMIR